MLARPEAATGVAPTLRAARREALGSVLPPKGPHRDSARPSTFDGEYPDRGAPGESDGRNVAHGDGPQAASARTGEVPRGCRPGSLSSDDSEGLLRGDHAERSPSTLRCGPIRVASPFSRAYAMVPGPCMAYLDHERPQDWSTFGHARGHTHKHTPMKAECPRAPSGRGRAASTTGRTTQSENLPRTKVYLFFSPPGWPVGTLSVKTRPPGMYVCIY